MYYLKLFQNHSQYEEFAGGGGMLKPNVSHCIQENEVHYNPITNADRYLTFIALENGTFTFEPQNNNVISYSTDGGETWTEGNSVEIINGDKVMWKGEMTPLTRYGIGKFSSTANFDIQGNAMSLLYGDNFKGQTDLTEKDYALYQLFYQNTKVISAENLSLPATTLALQCYYGMFKGCTSLTTAPELPATTLAQYCYSGMFSQTNVLPDCSNIDFTSESVVSSGGLRGLFSGTKVTDSDLDRILPKNANGKYCLPVMTLTNNCYQAMFEYCANLTTAPELPATTLANSCYDSMFMYCTNLTTAPKLPATTLANNCYSSMFYHCTSLTTAPELPALTLTSYCYRSMFQYCRNLNYIKCLATDVSANRCLLDWVDDVNEENGTFVKSASMTSWPKGPSGIPNKWTVQDATE